MTGRHARNDKESSTECQGDEDGLNTAFIKKKIQQAYCYDSVFVNFALDIVANDNHFFEAVVYAQKRGNIKAPVTQFIVDDVFHNVRLFLLPEKVISDKNLLIS